jgi:hypothetical protein
MFSVSAVASADACLLKAIFQASSHEGALLQGPLAVLGSITHELVERAIRGIGRTGEAAFEELERVLGVLLEDARERLMWEYGNGPFLRLAADHEPIGLGQKAQNDP